MSFFDTIGNYFKLGFNAVKDAAPAVFSGIKKGLELGRSVLDVAGPILKVLKYVPVLGKFANIVEPFVEPAKQVVDIGTKITGGIDTVVNKRVRIPRDYDNPWEHML